MCLSVVKHRFFFPRSTKESQVGYKWFNSNLRLFKAGFDKELLLSNHIISSDRKYQLNKWYTSTKWKILEGCYFTGFHILNTFEDALTFECKMSDGFLLFSCSKENFDYYYSINSENTGSRLLAKVEYKNIVASGYQCGSAIVAQKMKIVEVL